MAPAPNDRPGDEALSPVPRASAGGDLPPPLPPAPPSRFQRWIVPPALTRNRVFLACAVALVIDGLQMGLGPLGWAFTDQILDLIGMILTVGLLGFHPLLLPTFLLEALPVIDMLPTWSACVVAVIAIRRRAENKAR